MNTFKLLRYVLFATVTIAISLSSCEKLELYTIDSPSDLQSKVDSIAAEKNKGDTGDTTFINISKAIVGADDNSSGWWSEFSDYFKVPSGKLLNLEFINHSSGANNWNNWNLAITNEVADRDDSGYKEYFVLRSDAFGWGGTMAAEGYSYDGNMISHNYADVSDNDDFWADFRTTMQGAYVTLEIDHSATGNVFVTATALGTNGVELVMTYQQPVSAANDIVAFLVCDGSYFEVKKAYLIPSKMVAVEDVKPVSISVSGMPELVELGNEDFWGDATAVITFEDGSSAEVDFADLSFNTIPDMSTPGVKTVIVTYSKTKQGAYTQAVSTLYTLEVTNPISELEVTTLPLISTYYFYSEDPIIFNKTGIVVTATFSDGTQSVVSNNSLQFSNITAQEGTQEVLISYVGESSTITTTCPITLVKGTAQVGVNDFSTGWWTAFSEDYPVASGASKAVTLYCYSNNAENYNSPSVILRKESLEEFAVVRMDHFGWGDGFATAVASSNWNWDTFKPNISGSKVVITVTNNGDNTADVHYDVTFANGDTHFQNYDGVTIDSSDLNFALVTEGAYLVIID